MRKINVVLFSSGISEKNGILEYVKQNLSDYGYNCVYWRDLFRGAHDPNNLSLLPLLIKKIPTFDFAILICEGHDKTYILRNGVEEEVPTMRDNVLFEIGLCTMALGLPRTILLTDDIVRIPDDLTGYNNALAVKRIIYQPELFHSYELAGQELIDYMGGLQEPVQLIDSYIQSNITTISPVVIGAAASTACGYVGNFVFRTLEQINTGIVLEDNPERQFYPIEKIFFHIILPEIFSPEIPAKAREILKQYKTASVPDARMRSAEFHYLLIKDELHILDFPTSLTTSYNTARIILSLDADDDFDIYAKDRFIAKEIDLFECTLSTLLNRSYINEIVNQYYKDVPSNAKAEIIHRVADIVENRTSIERMKY